MINDKVYFVFRNVKFYTCCDEPYLDITFNITMRRYVFFFRHHYFILIITGDPFYVLVRTQYSVDPGQPPPPYRLLLANRFQIYLPFWNPKDNRIYLVSRFFFILKIKDPFLGKKAKTYQIVAW